MLPALADKQLRPLSCCSYRITRTCSNQIKATGQQFDAARPGDEECVADRSKFRLSTGHGIGDGIAGGG